MQRSRNRGCCQRQHIHILFHLFDLFFMCHAKPLFLINDQQTEIFALHILRQQAVGSDHDIHGSTLQPLQSRFLLLRSTEPAHQFHIDRKILHPLCKCIVMLLCQNRRRHQINNLFFLLRCFESRSDCHLGLAKTNVTANQTIHDLPAFHIRLRRFDGKTLILRLIIWKHFLKFPLPYRIRSILIAFLTLPDGIQFHQFLRHFLYRFLYPVPGLCPLLSAQTVQLRFLRIRTGIFLDQIKLCRQHIQIAAFIILNLHVIPHGLVNFDFLYAAENTETVILMHHIISRFQFGETLDMLTLVNLLFLFPFLLFPTKNVGLCQHDEFDIRIFKSAFQLAIQHHDFSRLHRTVCISRKKCIQFLLSQIVRHTLRTGPGAAHEDHPVFAFFITFQIFGE